MNSTNITPIISPHQIIIHINAGRIGTKITLILVIVGGILIIAAVAEAIAIIINIPNENENHHHLPKIHFNTKVSITIPKKLKKINSPISQQKQQQQQQKPKLIAIVRII